MQQISIFLILVLASMGGWAKPPVASPCHHDQTECSFYCQKARQLSCSKQGYLISTGHKYCAIYKMNNHQFSPLGQSVLARLRMCLIDSLKDAKTCQQTEHQLVTHHVKCYVGSGFCSLGLQDRVRIVYFAAPMMGSSDFYVSAFQVLKNCESQRRSR